MEKGKVKRKSSPPSSDVEIDKKKSFTPSGCQAGGNRRMKAISSKGSLVTGATEYDAEIEKKKPFTSYGCQAGGNRKAKAIYSKGNLVIGGTESGEIKDGSDDDPPEEIFHNPSPKKFNRKRKDGKNPYNCPDIDDPYEWTSEDRKNYREWLYFESGRRALTRDEQDYLTTFGISNPTGKRTSFKH